MKTNLVPLDNRVVVELIEEDSVTPGGIILSDKSKGKPTRGKVLAVGPGKWQEGGGRFPMTLKVGDTVVFSSYSGNLITFIKDDVLVIREDEILCKIEKPGD